MFGSAQLGLKTMLWTRGAGLRIGMPTFSIRGTPISCRRRCGASSCPPEGFQTQQSLPCAREQCRCQIGARFGSSGHRFHLIPPKSLLGNGMCDFNGCPCRLKPPELRFSRGSPRPSAFCQAVRNGNSTECAGWAESPSCRHRSRGEEWTTCPLF